MPGTVHSLLVYMHWTIADKTVLFSNLFTVLLLIRFEKAFFDFFVAMENITVA